MGMIKISKIRKFHYLTYPAITPIITSGTLDKPNAMGFHLRGQMWTFIHEGFGHHREFPSHARKKVPPHPHSPGPHPFLCPAVAQQGSSEGHPAHSWSLVDWPEGLVFMVLLLCRSPRASLCFRAMKNTEARGLLQ